MEIKLKKIHSPDVGDLEHFVPKKFNDFSVLIQAFIGPTNGPGEESFDFVLCTPIWIENEIKKDKYLFGKGFLIVNEYHYESLLNIIQGLCKRVSGNDWNTIAKKLSRFGNWEFEDYQES